MRMPFTGTSVAKDIHGPTTPTSEPDFQAAVRNETRPSDAITQARDNGAYKIGDPSPRPPRAPEAGDPTRFQEIKAEIAVGRMLELDRSRGL